MTRLDHVLPAHDSLTDKDLLLRPVIILIPAYGAADKLRNCLKSLAAHLPPQCSVHVLDDATPDDSVQAVCTDPALAFQELTYTRTDRNRGFVTTCNWGLENFWNSGSDLLLLNSDTEVTSGFLTEMQQVLYLHEKHAVVTPRSNNATIFSIPFSGDRLEPARSFTLWNRLKQNLPRYQLMPTAVGFCMLVKGRILEHFQLFDAVYGHGYNEENDFVCRINRLGYSAVAANRAFVFHYETSSFGPRRADLEAHNRRILLGRYPEYERKVQEYIRFDVDPLELFAPIYDPHRPRILYDMFHVSPVYNGTTEFALTLLQELTFLLEQECDLHVGMRGEPLAFFASELRGHRIYKDSEGSRDIFDLIFKPAQVFAWPDFERMNRLAPRVCCTLQDIITVRCEYLNSARMKTIFRKVVELSDHVFTISEFSKSDFQAFYGWNCDEMEVIHHGTAYSSDSFNDGPGEYILVIGNHYAHKGIHQVVPHLERTSWPVVVLGEKGPETVPTAHIRWIPSGYLTRQHIRDLFAKARMIVYPSHYEGFGLPVTDALALGKPVIALDNAINQELAKLTFDPNLYLIPSAAALTETVDKLWNAPQKPQATQTRTWRDAAEEYARAIRRTMSQDIDLTKMRARWDFIRSIETLVG